MNSPAPSFIPIEGRGDLFRDIRSNTIVTADKTALDAAKARKESVKALAQQVSEHSNTITLIQEEIPTIKRDIAVILQCLQEVSTKLSNLGN